VQLPHLERLRLTSLTLVSVSAGYLHYSTSQLHRIFKYCLWETVSSLAIKLRLAYTDCLLGIGSCIYPTATMILAQGRGGVGVWLGRLGGSTVGVGFCSRDELCLFFAEFGGILYSL